VAIEKSIVGPLFHFLAGHEWSRKDGSQTGPADAAQYDYLAYIVPLRFCDLRRRPFETGVWRNRTYGSNSRSISAFAGISDMECP
jgi:hypothetical protein